MEDITDVEHRHSKKVFKNLSNKNLGDYHDLYVQSDTLLLYEIDPAQFLSAPGLAWQACLKKTDVKLELLTDPDILRMVEKGIRGGIYRATHRYAKANNKCMKNYDENEKSLFLEYLDVNNLYGGAMSESLPINGFDRMEDLSKIDENCIENYDKDNDKGYILEVVVQYPQKFT